MHSGSLSRVRWNDPRRRSERPTRTGVSAAGHGSSSRAQDLRVCGCHLTGGLCSLAAPAAPTVEHWRIVPIGSIRSRTNGPVVLKRGSLNALRFPGSEVLSCGRLTGSDTREHVFAFSRNCL